MTSLTAVLYELAVWPLRALLHRAFHHDTQRALLLLDAW